MEMAWFLQETCVEYARNIILFLFEREREGYKRCTDCTVHVYILIKEKYSQKEKCIE